MGGGHVTGDRQAASAQSAPASGPPGELPQGRVETGAIVEDLDPGYHGATVDPHLHHPAAVFDRVGDQVPGRLGEPQPITPDHPRATGPGHRQGNAGGRRAAPPGLDRVGDQAPQVDPLELGNPRSGAAHLSKVIQRQ
jgi:hypothetical protein